MNIAAYAIIAAAIIALIIIIVSVIKSESVFSPPEDKQKQYGRRGEKAASEIIRSVFNDEDRLFTNINISFGENSAELDNVIVNKYGVFIIEVKDWKGHIVGTEDDRKWKKYKTTDAGNTYVKTADNPIRQVKRQVYLLANYFREQGVNVWIDGYVIMLQNNSPLKNKIILTDIYEIDKVLHTFTRKKLDSKTIESVVRILSQTESRDV